MTIARRSIFSTARDEYAAHALRIAGKYLPDTGLNLDNLYADVRLILWGADAILRLDYAPLTQLIVEVRYQEMSILILFPVPLIRYHWMFSSLGYAFHD